MTDNYRTGAAVRGTLVKRNDKVGRPMSLKLVFFVWLFLLVANHVGTAWFDFGGAG